MHARLIVLLDKEVNDNSETVRSIVDQKLMDSGFAGEGGLFCSPPADWFAVC